MKPYIEKLKTYLAQNPPDYSGAESILSLLYQTYTAYNPIDNQKIKDSFAWRQQTKRNQKDLRQKV